jgi:rod shape determining protein RodA
LRLVVAAAVLAVFLIPVSYVAGVKSGVIKPYQQERINVILDPENADRKGIGYHTWQSIITVGEGGLFGSKSSAEFSQSGLKFLPEPHTDFIYAVTAENSGFVGCLLVLVAYVILLSRLITGARRSSDRMGMLFVMAFVGGLTFQIFINIGMALGISPVIGVPLPLMSAGLASLIATFIAIGFAISVQLRRFVN